MKHQEMPGTGLARSRTAGGSAAAEGATEMRMWAGTVDEWTTGHGQAGGPHGTEADHLANAPFPPLEFPEGKGWGLGDNGRDRGQGPGGLEGWIYGLL